MFINSQVAGKWYTIDNAHNVHATDLLIQPSGISLLRNDDDPAGANHDIDIIVNAGNLTWKYGGDGMNAALANLRTNISGQPPAAPHKMSNVKQKAIGQCAIVSGISDTKAINGSKKDFRCLYATGPRFGDAKYLATFIRMQILICNDIWKQIQHLRQHTNHISNLNVYFSGISDDIFSPEGKTDEVSIADYIAYKIGTLYTQDLHHQAGIGDVHTIYGGKLAKFAKGIATNSYQLAPFTDAQKKLAKSPQDTTASANLYDALMQVNTVAELEKLIKDNIAGQLNAQPATPSGVEYNPATNTYTVGVKKPDKQNIAPPQKLNQNKIQQTKNNIDEDDGTGDLEDNDDFSFKPPKKSDEEKKKQEESQPIKEMKNPITSINNILARTPALSNIKPTTTKTDVLTKETDRLNKGAPNDTRYIVEPYAPPPDGEKIATKNSQTKTQEEQKSIAPIIVGIVTTTICLTAAITSALIAAGKIKLEPFTKQTATIIAVVASVALAISIIVTLTNYNSYTRTNNNQPNNGTQQTKEQKGNKK